MERLDTITFPTGDDMHLHVRQGAALQAVVPQTARQFARAIIMPNTTPPTTTTGMAATYRAEVLAGVPEGFAFTPLMTLYLTGATTPEMIREAKDSGIIHGVKFYPAGATTNSEAGLADLQNAEAVLAMMEEVGLPLLLHGETADPLVDVFERETRFIDETLPWVIKKFPRLRFVLEHITTRRAAQFVMAAGANVVATITPQHILANRNDMLGSGVRPHYYCKPILKHEDDREHLLRVATSGNRKFFLGTDSAPHPRHGEWSKAKETGCGCAGCFSAHAALELYAEAFDSVGAIAMLPDFASRFGREFYGLPENPGFVTLTREEWMPPQELAFGSATLVPFRAEKPLKWRAVRHPSS